MYWLTICILTAILVAYLFVGGAIFMALEKTKEEEMATSQASAFKQFIDDHPCVTANELAAFARTVIDAYDSGVVATMETTSASNWEYIPSVFFSMTVVTSIGYGHISPSTTGGRVFFVPYAIIGIPFTAVLLAAIGEKMASPFKKLEKKEFFPKHPKAERIGKMFIFTVVCFILFSLIPAAVFHAIEDWSYLEAWYYTIVTLTTVGFGDFVPGQSDSRLRVLYKLAVGLWIFLGLSWLSMVLNIAGDFVKAKTTEVDKDIERKIGDDKGFTNAIELAEDKDDKETQGK